MSLVRSEELEQQGDKLVRDAQALAIVDDASYAEAGERRKLVKVFLARADETIGPSVEAAHKAHKAAVALLASVKKPAQDADDIYKRGRLAYEEKRERERREAEAAAARERARLEAAERERVENERRRLQEEAEERRALEVKAAEVFGDTEEAERIIAAPIVVQAPVARPVVVQTIAPPPPPPKAEGIVARMEWDFEIVDPAAVPREYLAIDEKKVRGVVRALKGSANIPGVRVFQRRNESIR